PMASLSRRSRAVFMLRGRDVVMTESSIAVTPAGHVLLTEVPGEKTLREAWERGEAEGLLQLAFTEGDVPPELAFFRALATQVVSAVCTTPGIEELRERVEVAVNAPAQLFDAR